MTDTFHFPVEENSCKHPSFGTSAFGVELCIICGKTKETILHERIESIEGAISELNDALLHFSREVQVLNLRFGAFVDMVLAYSKGAAEDVEAFKHLGEGNADDTEQDEESS
jgi:hypothetical protein